MTRAKKATFQGVPTEKIEESLTKWESVYVKLFRRVAGGKLSALGPRHMSPHELTKIEEYLGEMAGGGKFRVEPRNPENLLEYADPIPPFEVEIEGRPKPATPAEHGLRGIGGGISAMEGPQQMLWGQPGYGPYNAPMAEQAYPQAPGQANLPGWMRQMPPAMAAGFAGQQQPHKVLNMMGETGTSYAQAPSAMYSSDYLGVQQLNYTREQLTKERVERENDRKEWDRRFEMMQESMNASKEEARAAREKAERDRLEAKLEAMTQAQNAKPAISAETWVGIATAVAPVLTAVVSSGQARAAVQTDAQTKAVELQMNGMQSLLSASQNKTSDVEGIVKTVAGLAPMITPFITKMAENKSPGAQADLFSTLAENNLTTLTTMGQFLQAMMEANGNDPWWRPMIESAIESVQQVGAQMAVQAGSRPAPQAQADGAPAASPKPPMSQGAMLASTIVNSSQFPPELKTGAWFQAIAAMHDQVEPQQIADHIAQHVVELANADALPDLLDGIMGAEPRPVLEQLMNPMPIAKQNPQYADQIINATVDRLSQVTPLETSAEVVPPSPAVPMAAPVPSAAVGNGASMPRGGGEPPGVPFDLAEPSPVQV